MARRGTVLVIDDNRNILVSLKYLLGDYFAKVLTANDPGVLPSLLLQEQVDVALLDMNFSPGLNNGNEGLYWLRYVKQLRLQVQVVLFTAYADISLAVAGMKDGAFDFVVKPWDNARLVQTLLDAYRESKGEKRRNDKHQAKSRESEMYWGHSPVMQHIKSVVERVSATDANVLITGENGTGKDMLAREIHRLSGRSGNPMVVADMGAVAETLFESELFGHVKGAFTGAFADRVGRFEAADGGTLFLDEIANLPYHLQSKLLTVIQKHSVVKVGSNIEQSIDVRLICATNRDLDLMVRKGEFREDLLYRINTIHLHLPPLRERPDDIVAFADMFVKRYSQQYGRGEAGLSAGARQSMLGYSWPGNIRELQHAIERAVILSDSGGEIDMLQISSNKSAGQQTSRQDAIVPLDEMERNMVQMAIDKCNGNLSAAAAQLGITRQTLYNKMKRYGL